MHKTDRFRPDIQGLRAVAVLTVLIFHVFPGFMSGGYVGVDVFFVVSGFLITSLLIRASEREQGIDFSEFYSRRFRRLLPAASVVLLTVIVLTPTLPPSRWLDTAWQVVASTLYVENWFLAFQAVDYMNVDAAPSPLQHFWSLSIEEQFYLLWPALIGLCSFIAARSGLNTRAVLLGAFGLLFAGSLGFSVWLSHADTAAAYFYSHTRFWELAIGGLLALWRPGRPLPGWASASLTLGGLGAILVSAFLYTPATIFPGYTALLPVLGTVAVLAAGAQGGLASGTVGTILSNRPSQWLGDISYSLYLWHWPAIIFYTAWTGEEITLIEGAGLIAVSLLLAHLSKVFVEDRFRTAPATGVTGTYPGTLAAGLVSMGVCAGAALVLIGIVRFPGQSEITVANYPGALVFSDGYEAAEGVDFVPGLATARSDIATTYTLGCHGSFEATEPTPCVYGEAGSDFHVVLVGDSHAANWLPALEEVAAARGWALSSITKSSCPFLTEMTMRAGAPYPECQAWVTSALEALAETPPDLVVFAMSLRHFVAGAQDREVALRSAVLSVFDRFAEAGIPVVAMRDTPQLPYDPLECFAADPDCHTTLDSALATFDPAVAAAQERAAVPVVDMLDLLCPDETCPMVIGNILVWRDDNHFTASYSRSMSNALSRRLDDTGLTPGRADPSAERLIASAPLRVVLQCEALGQYPEFTREIRLEPAGNGAYTFLRGDRQAGSYERWSLTIDGEHFTVGGEYREGPPELKLIDLSGEVASGRLTGTGQRGPRNCTLEGILPGEAAF